MTTEATATDTATEPTDKDRNFEALRQENERLKAENAALTPKALREDVRLAGFDPESDKGKVLVKDLSRGDVQIADGQTPHEALRAYAENEYQWKPPTQLTPQQEQMRTDQRFQDGIAQASHSDSTSGDDRSDYLQRITEAREKGDYATASRIQMEYERKFGRQ